MRNRPSNAKRLPIVPPASRQESGATESSIMRTSVFIACSYPSPLLLTVAKQIFGCVVASDEAAGWRFIGLNSLIMNTGIPSEYEQEEWLQSQLSGTNGKPIALFLHKPLFLMTPDDPEEPGTAIRYVPQPVRSKLVEMLGAHDVRLVASGHVHQRRDFTYGHARHVWAPSTGFIMPERIQPVIGAKECGLVEYRFQPDSFEVRHVRAPGQTDVGLDSLIGRK